MKANFIVVGGPISVGKSTLVNDLPFPQANELNFDDEVQMLILENTYKKDRIKPEVIELYFLELRKEKYKSFSQEKELHVLDRSIFESLWFAKQNMNSESFNHFKLMWENSIKELIKDFGKPKLYILLSMNWETFETRFFKRGRKVEVDNFNSNKLFFQKHIQEYDDHMIEVFNLFEINYVKIKTDNLSADDVKELSFKNIKEVIK